MENITLLSQNELAKITNHRSGEIKFGEKIITIPKDANVIDFITNSDAKFVLLGIPEDIGVRANLGRAGAATAYESALQSLANIQHNKFCKGSNLIVLGQLNVLEEMEKAQNLDLSSKENRKELFKLVEK
jgi:formiminoglutamase